MVSPWLAAGGALGAAAVTLQLGRYFWAASAAFRPRRGAVDKPVALAAVSGTRDVILRTPAGLALRGWYLPSRNRAALVLGHGSRANRAALAAEAALFADHGYGVLLFDFPGHGESEGRVHWDAGERAALTSALDFLAEQPDVDPSRLGVYGFSMGGFIASQVAPDEPRVRALALIAAPTSMNEVLRWQYRVRGPFSYVPALAAFHVHGVKLAFDVRSAVRHFTGRPLLIAAGDADSVVPPRMARELYAAAGSPKQLHMVAGAGHGGYVQHDPAFGPTLLEFFERALGR